MKLLFLINGLRFGGMERQLVETIKAVSTAGHNAYLAVLNEKGPFADELETYLSNEIFYLDRRKINILMTMIMIVRITRSLKVDIIHVQDSFSAFYALPVAKLIGISTVNGSIRHAGINKGIDYIFEKFFLLMSDAIVANSHAGLDYYHVKGKVVYNFIEMSRFSKSGAPLTKIVMNANFSDYKDHLALFVASRMLFDEGLVSEIGLIGDGRHRKFYEKLCGVIGIIDNVVFYGHCSNVEELLLDYGIGVLCSTYEYKEGISNSILEYMGSGLIAIGSDIGAVPEIIIDGWNGFLYRVESPNSLAGKIRYIVQHPDQMVVIRANAYDTLRTKFNMKSNSRQIIQVYDEVLMGSS